MWKRKGIVTWGAVLLTLQAVVGCAHTTAKRPSDDSTADHITSKDISPRSQDSTAAGTASRAGYAAPIGSGSTSGM